MSLHTNLQGRLRNTDLPKSHGLLPVFETVVNSIHSLEERGNLTTTGSITLKIKREPQLSTIEDNSHIPDIDDFIVEDNGIGFNNANMQSFETLDSDHKMEKGCRGVGRLLWLKAFDYIDIYSSFKDTNDITKLRRVRFDATNGVNSLLEEGNKDKDISTCVHLHGFDKKYRKHTPKSADSIARALLEHCLWYFVRAEGAPMIRVYDNNENILLNDLYDSYMHESACGETINIGEYDFNLIHIKFRASSSKKHSLSLCAAGRLVKEETISSGKIPGLYGKLSDNNGEFIYSCYVSSVYLDERVRPERTSFNISEDVEDLLSNSEFTLRTIRQRVLERSEEYLSKYLEGNIAAGRERVDKFIAEKAPRYRPIIPHISENDLAIDPSISDKDLELHLYKHLADVERTMLKKGHEIMATFGHDIDDYKERLDEYLKTAEDIKKSDLANYVSHRHVVIDLLDKAIQKNSAGKYSKEDFIHKLIMPMQKDSNEVLRDAYNLWLVDERLAFHNYLASDKTINSMPITGDISTKEPDICSLNVYDNPILVSENQSPPLASITIIEIKRPMRNDAKAGEDKDPIEQSLSYLNRIREGEVTTASGRPIPNSKEIPGFCYIICDLTPSIIQRCKLFGLTVTHDHMGYFGYNPNYKAYIEVISYDKLVKTAKERNRAFFEKLGLPSN